MSERLDEYVGEISRDLPRIRKLRAMLVEYQAIIDSGAPRALRARFEQDIARLDEHERIEVKRLADEERELKKRGNVIDLTAGLVSGVEKKSPSVFDMGKRGPR